MNPDYKSDILDEIALEGLDGITIPTLWKRLSVRPNFCLKPDCDENIKNFIWTIIISLEDVIFYKLSTPRPELIHFDTLNQSQEEQKKAIAELDSLYPYKKLVGVLGSCADLDTRLDITTEVVGLPLMQVVEQWGSSLVIVATQEARIWSLFGDRGTPNLDLPAPHIQFAILERIGRARYQGLPSFGTGSVQSIVDDSKAIFHYLKFLLRNSLVKKQSQVGSLQPSVTNGHSMYYLTRFYGDQSMECQLIMEAAVYALKARPNYIIPYDDFYALFDKNKRPRVYKFIKAKLFKKYISGNKMFPFRQIYPDAPKSEWEKKTKNGEKLVRCFQLIDPNTEISDIIDKDYEPDGDEITAGFSSGGVYYSDLPLYSQAYQHIKDAGGRGLSELELENKTGMDKVFARGMLKRLMKDKSCTWFMEASGRQRIRKYIIGEDNKKMAAVSEIEQILLDKNAESPAEGGLGGGPDGADMNVRADPTDTPTTSQPKPRFRDDNVSYRTVKRIGLIMKAIKANRYRKFYQLHKMITDEEAKEGLTARMDRVTLHKILDKLYQDDCIKVFRFTGNSGGDVKTVKLYADPSYFPEEDAASVLMNSEPYIAGGDDASNDLILEEVLSICLVENQIRMKFMIRDVVTVTGFPSSRLEKSYSPKFARLNVLHNLLFYIVYGYRGPLHASQEEMLQELSKKVPLDEQCLAEIPKIYDCEFSPYIFVPPLTNKHAHVPGWCLLSDLLLRIPLSIFVKVVRVHDPTPELIAFLDHPVRKYFLVQDLPLAIRQCLFQRRSYLSAISDDLKRLCFMGLLQIGPRCGKDKFQNFLYVNRKASLLNTTLSSPQYYQIDSSIEYPVEEYLFKTMDDVQTYWKDAVDVCLNTHLGVKSSMIGKEITAEREFMKDALKISTECRSVSAAKLHDDGSVPGDRLGAGGFDSTMFTFLRNNWMATKKKSSTLEPRPFDRKTRGVAPAVDTQPVVKPKKKEGRLKRLHKKVATAPVIQPLVVRERKSFRRQVKPRQDIIKRPRRVAYDEDDIEALKMMNTLRVTWTIEEDNLLLLCRVALAYLTPNLRKFMRIPWVEVRKLMQQQIPQAKNKTQRAVGRRATYMMKNPTTVRSVELCLEELRQIPEVRARFNCSHISDAILPSTPNYKELQEELFAKFRELVLFMKSRFIEGSTLKLKEKVDLIPDTMEEFTEMFGLQDVPQPAITTEDIRRDVIRAILMSALSCKSDKTSSAVQLFEIYRQYDEDELRDSVRGLHEDKVLTQTKKIRDTKEDEYLPLTQCPYRLSITFEHLLNTKYKHDIYSMAFQQVEQLLENEGDESEIDMDLGECNLAVFTLASRGIISFRIILPKTICLFKDEHNKNSAPFSNPVVQRYCDMLRITGSSSKLVCTLGKLYGNVEEVDTKEEEDVHDEVEEAIEGIKEEPDNEEELGVATGLKAHDYFLVNSSKVMMTLDKTAILDHRQNLQPSNVSDLIKNLVDEKHLPLNLVDEGPVLAEFSHTHDKFELKLLKEILDLVLSRKELGATKEDLRQLGRVSILAPLLKFLLQQQLIISVGADIHRYVSQKFRLPWVLSSFKMKRLDREKLGPTKLNSVLLQDNNDDESSETVAKKRKIDKGVVSGEQLMTLDHAPPTCSQQNNNKVYIIMRPWLRIDGTLNRKVLDRYLGSVLGHILSKPGASLEATMNKFSPFFIPMWTKELVEMLHRIGCIHISTITRCTSSSLFDKHQVHLSDVYTGLEDEDSVMLEPTLDAVSILGQFIGRKTYAKDFLVY